MAPLDATGPRSPPTQFLIKTYRLVDDRNIDDIISWTADGSTFVVWRPGDFARDLLPRKFKHNNFSSFVRQLNTYGFKKVSPDMWEFSHELFRKDQEHLLGRIKRRNGSTVNAPVAAATDKAGSSVDEPLHGGTTQLMEENEQLKRENARLASENAQMKGFCNSRHLVSNYGGGDREAAACGLELEALIGSWYTIERSSNSDLRRAKSVSESSGLEEEELNLDLSLSNLPNKRECKGFSRHT